MTGTQEPDGIRQARRSSATAAAGRVLLEALAPRLRDLGVPPASYIIVNIANGRFVTGKTRQEANQRFALLHAGAKGWLQRVGDVVGDRQTPESNP